eukprot:COSAG06_NODE_1842_length_8236_cov_57.085904_3_plen_73_part_00
MQRSAGKWAMFDSQRESEYSTPFGKPVVPCRHKMPPLCNVSCACPEPGLVNWSFFSVEDGSKKAFCSVPTCA